MQWSSNPPTRHTYTPLPMNSTLLCVKGSKAESLGEHMYLDVKLPILFLEVPCLKPCEVTSNGCSGTALQLIAGKWGEKGYFQRNTCYLCCCKTIPSDWRPQYDFASTVQEISFHQLFQKSLPAILTVLPTLKLLIWINLFHRIFSIVFKLHPISDSVQGPWASFLNLHKIQITVFLESKLRSKVTLVIGQYYKYQAKKQTPCSYFY